MKGVWMALGATALCCACEPPLPRYVPPAESVPHALFKIRSVYHQRPGPIFSQVATIDGHAISVKRERDPSAPSAVWTRAAPGHRAVRVTSRFSHTEWHQLTRTTLESYPCGWGKTSSTCTRSVTRTEMAAVDVLDGACRRTIKIAAEAGQTYLFDYIFHGPGSCSFHCKIQVQGDDDEAAFKPCD